MRAARLPSCRTPGRMRSSPRAPGSWAALIPVLAALTILTPGAAGAQAIYPVGMREDSNVLSWAYDPPELAINVGDTVVWTNTGVAAHTVTANDRSWDSGFIPSGEAFSWTFTVEGTFTYTCAPHPWMRGSVTVVAAAPPEEQAGATEEEEFPTEEAAAEAAAVP